MSAHTDTRPRIVVGIDGSACSRRALDWAMDQAERTSGIVEAITVWESTPPYGFFVPPPSNELADENRARRILAAAVEDAATRHPSVDMRAHTVEGNAEQVLMSAASGAWALAVGRHSRRAVAWRVLAGPSISRHLARNAPCPTVLVGETTG